MNSKEEKKLKPIPQSILSPELKEEWLSASHAFLKPLVIIPVIFTIIALRIANEPTIDKDLALCLQIFATVLTAIAGGSFYDTLKSISGNSILIKKGVSAVRNLSLARTKTINISSRSKENASQEEVVNLLSLLEKDIANATQEWHDILPTVNRIEEVYLLLADKEADLKHTQKQKEQLNSQLEKAIAAGQIENDVLKEELAKKEGKITELQYQIDKLNATTGSLASTAGNIFKFGASQKSLNEYSEGLMENLSFENYLLNRTCTSCGKTLETPQLGSLLIPDICPECFNKQGNK